MEGSEIKHFYNLLTQREEIDVIYDRYSGPGGQMSSRDLLNFLFNEQREEATLHDALRLIEKYEMDQTGKLHFGTRSSGGDYLGLACIFLFFLQQSRKST